VSTEQDGSAHPRRVLAFLPGDVPASLRVSVHGSRSDHTGAPTASPASHGLAGFGLDPRFLFW
jgi:hypothetical protein